MKLTIFGATGTIGTHLVKNALASGHEVTAFARNPQALLTSPLSISNPNLKLCAGDVLNPAAVSDAIKGSDAVLITLGSKKLSGNVRSAGTRNIVQAMEQHHVKRLICQSTLGAGDSWTNLNLFWKTIMFGFILRLVIKDHELQEDYVKHSALDWTIVRPAAFTDESLTDNYKSGFSATEKNLTLKISRRDVARFMLLQLTDNANLKQTPGLSY